MLISNRQFALPLGNAGLFATCYVKNTMLIYTSVNKRGVCYYKDMCYLTCCNIIVKIYKVIVFDNKISVQHSGCAFMSQVHGKWYYLGDTMYHIKDNTVLCIRLYGANVIIHTRGVSDAITLPVFLSRHRTCRKQ